MSRVHSYLNEIEADRLISGGKYTEAAAMLEESLKNGECIDRHSVLRNLSVCHMASGDFEKAMVSLKEVVKNDPADTDMLYNLAFCHFSLHDHPTAVKLFEQIKKNEGQRKDTAYNLGMSYLAVGDPASAVANFGFLAEDAASSSLVYNAGIALIGAQKPALAVDLFVRFLRLVPNDIDATFGLGMAYSRTGDDRKSVECMKRVIARDPEKYPSAFVSLAMSYFRIGDIRNCTENLDKVLRLYPDMAEAWYYRGFVYESAEQVGKAAECYGKAADIDPDLADAWLRLGQIRLRESRLDDAADSFRNAYRFSGDKRLAYRVALALIADRKYAEAIEYLLAAREAADGREYGADEVNENLAVCYYHTEDFVLSLEYGEMTEKGKRGPFLLFVMGSSAMKTGNLNRAESYFAHGLKKDPGDVNILYGLGILEGNRENFRLSKDYLEKALLIQRNLDIIYALALTEMKLGETHRAADLFEEYRQGNIGNADIQYKMGLVFIELKKPDLAREAFHETLKLKPGNRKAREYLLSLNRR